MFRYGGDHPRALVPVSTKFPDSDYRRRNIGRVMSLHFTSAPNREPRGHDSSYHPCFSAMGFPVLGNTLVVTGGLFGEKPCGAQATDQSVVPRNHSVEKAA